MFLQGSSTFIVMKFFLYRCRPCWPEIPELGRSVQKSTWNDCRCYSVYLYVLLRKYRDWKHAHKNKFIHPRQFPQNSNPCIYLLVLPQIPRTAYFYSAIELRIDNWIHAPESTFYYKGVLEQKYAHQSSMDRILQDAFWRWPWWYYPSSPQNVFPCLQIK